MTARPSGAVRPWVPWAARALLLLALLLAAAFTLGTRPTAETDLFARLLRTAVNDLTPFSADRLSTGRVEFAANVLLFLPLGLLLPPAFPRLPLTLLLAVPLVTSLGIEVAQQEVLQGRVPDAVDVLANGTGGAIGLLLGADLLRLARQRTG